MGHQSYFYQFLESESKELAYVVRELENSIFFKPTYNADTRTNFFETILRKEMKGKL